VDDLTSRALRVTIVAVAASVAAVLVFPAYLSILAGDSKIYEPERFDFVLLAVAAFCLALGSQVVPWRRARHVALLALLASGCLLFGFLAVFSIGLAVMPVGILCLVLLFRAIRRHELAVARPAALGGALVGYAVVLLYIAQAVPATAECFANGAGSSSRRWPGTGQEQQFSGGGGGQGGGVFTGHAEYGDSIVTFRCESGRMVEFHRTPR
jgi:uncharacterized membrane protein YgcG